MGVSMRITGQEDLSAAYERAVRAARQGDTVELERALAHLRRVNATNISTVGTTLRAVARCARSHPAGGVERRAAAS